MFRDGHFQIEDVQLAKDGAVRRAFLLSDLKSAGRRFGQTDPDPSPEGGAEWDPVT